MKLILKKSLTILQETLQTDDKNSNDVTNSNYEDDNGFGGTFRISKSESHLKYELNRNSSSLSSSSIAIPSVIKSTLTEIIDC